MYYRLWLNPHFRIHFLKQLLLTVYSTCFAVPKKKRNCEKNRIPDLISRTDDVKYLITLLTINIRLVLIKLLFGLRRREPF